MPDTKLILLVALLLVIWLVLWRLGGSRSLIFAIALLPLALVYEFVGRFAGERWQWAVAVPVLIVALYVSLRRRRAGLKDYDDAG